MHYLKKGFSVFLCVSGIFFHSMGYSQKITFIHINDIHAHLTPHKDLVAVSVDGVNSTQVVERGGLARMATLIKNIKSDNPNSIVMNIGDTYHGGVEALYTSGNAIVTPVNALNIDIGVPGNWDFAYGPFVTVQRYAKDKPLIHDLMTPMLTVAIPNYERIAANVSYEGFPDLTFMAPTTKRLMGDVKVGFIGITSDIVRKMHPNLALGFTFTGETPAGLTAAQKQAQYKILIEEHAKRLISEGIEIVVVMSELGIQKDYRLANVLEPGLVDVFFSAHTHEATFEPLETASGALVVEAGNDGFVGRMDLNVKNGVITKYNWALLPVDDSLAEDTVVKGLVDAARAPFLTGQFPKWDPNPLSLQGLHRPIDTVVGYTHGILHRRHALENPFNNMYTDLIRRMFPAQLTVMPGFRFDAVIEGDPFIAGEITLEDVYRFFPVSYAITRGTVTGERLKEIMEGVLTEVYSPEAFAQNGGWFEGWSGVEANIDLTAADGSRITDLYFTDPPREKIEPTTTTVLSVTGCGRTVFDALYGIICSHGGFTGVLNLTHPFTWEDPLSVFVPWTNIDAFVYGLDLMDGVKDGQGLVPLTGYTRKNMIEKIPTPSWPDTPYIQPLTGVVP